MLAKKFSEALGQTFVVDNRAGAGGVVGCDGVMNVWDYAAVQLIVEEAGGRCTTFEGNEPHAGGSFVSTNGRLHEDVVSLLSV